MFGWLYCHITFQSANRIGHCETMHSKCFSSWMTFAWSFDYDTFTLRCTCSISTGVFFVFGTFLAGPAYHYWFSYLDELPAAVYRLKQLKTRSTDADGCYYDPLFSYTLCSVQVLAIILLSAICWFYCLPYSWSNCDQAACIFVLYRWLSTAAIYCIMITRKCLALRCDSMRHCALHLLP